MSAYGSATSTAADAVQRRRVPVIAAVNKTARVVVADRVLRADTVLSRLIGLLGRDGLGDGEALWISPCKGIHTMGMKFPIDVIFLDDALRVVGLRERVVPWRATRFFRQATSVLEVAAGSIGRTRISIGDQLELSPMAAENFANATSDDREVSR